MSGLADLLSVIVDTELTGQERSRLARARANGYLDATLKSTDYILRAHGYWCWRLRVPLVWFDRPSPYARRGNVHLDLFTTSHVLTARGQAQLSVICDKLKIPARATVTPFDAVWRDVPKPSLDDLAAVVLRLATRYGNYELRPQARSPELLRLIEAITTPQPVEHRKTA